jgi:hypothetical protein
MPWPARVSSRIIFAADDPDQADEQSQLPQCAIDLSSPATIQS